MTQAVMALDGLVSTQLSCKGRAQDLLCTGEGQTVAIQSSVYGYTQENNCAEAYPFTDSTPVAENATDPSKCEVDVFKKVERRCAAFSRCRFQVAFPIIASEVVAECPGGYAYLKTTYSCVTLTNSPSTIPPTSKQPTAAPQQGPQPTDRPTRNPTLKPTGSPTLKPTRKPTNTPTPFPTAFPSNNPTPQPTKTPTKLPTPYPTSSQMELSPCRGVGCRTSFNGKGRFFDITAYNIDVPAGEFAVVNLTGLERTDGGAPFTNFKGLAYDEKEVWVLVMDDSQYAGFVGDNTEDDTNTCTFYPDWKLIDPRCEFVKLSKTGRNVLRDELQLNDLHAIFFNPNIEPMTLCLQHYHTANAHFQDCSRAPANRKYSIGGLAGPTPRPSHAPSDETSNPTKTPTKQPTVDTTAPSKSPTRYPTKHPSQSPTTTTQAPSKPEGTGFDFSGCDAGGGRFVVDLITPMETQPLGIIPMHTKDLDVQLTADKDIDVTLFDVLFPKNSNSAFKNCTIDTATDNCFSVVGWCDSLTFPDCNLGLLNGAEKDTKRHKGVDILYSGYNGDGLGNKGNEFIKIEAQASPSDLLMGLLAFEVGTATVQYSFSGSSSPCCMGTGSCGGEFEAQVAEKEYVTIGTIPAGKLDLEIILESNADVDVQLYDTAADRAIIAYCYDAPGTPVTCGENKKGYLGNNLYGTAESAEHKGVVYDYSGWAGVDGRLGHEYIRIVGETNTPLLMTAFGYAAGDANITYSYFNPKVEV